MIHVQPQPEPATFSELVRKPGNAFLTHTSKPTEHQWKAHSYWGKIAADLYAAYSAICAYSCHWIPPDTGWRTIEHFKPKSKYPHDAYDWHNYRLVCGTLNGRKGNHEDVLDPFTLADGWFELEFPSLIIAPSTALSTRDADSVEKTIKRLKLNEDPACFEARQSWVMAYATGEISYSHLEKRAPFIARELTRQNLVLAIKSMMVAVPNPMMSKA